MTNLLLLIIAFIWLIGACCAGVPASALLPDRGIHERALSALAAGGSRPLAADPPCPRGRDRRGAGGRAVRRRRDCSPRLIAIVAALIAVYPPDEGEIKKQFRPTPRAKRLLGASFVTLVVVGVLRCWLANQVDSGSLQPALVGALGLVLFLIAPLALVVGNLLMTPVEAAFRRRFINRARRTLARRPSGRDRHHRQLRQDQHQDVSRPHPQRALSRLPDAQELQHADGRLPRHQQRSRRRPQHRLFHRRDGRLRPRRNPADLRSRPAVDQHRRRGRSAAPGALRIAGKHRHRQVRDHQGAAARWRRRVQPR